MAESLQKRPMLDIAEMRKYPYPNIQIHVNDSDMRSICLVLSPENWCPLHLTVMVPENYPLGPPRVMMDSAISHPNVFGSYICASILNTTEGYTPAYTLKAIAIQLLSFFSSDSVEQVTGGKVSLSDYRNRNRNHTSGSGEPASRVCAECRFDFAQPAPLPGKRPGVPSRRSKKNAAKAFASATNVDGAKCHISRLPNEVILQILENLDFEELTKFAKSWGRVGKLITSFDVLRVRELQCFVLKENYKTRYLGVGVSVVGNGRYGTLQSEFDVLSWAAYNEHKVRRSIQGVPFTHWMPLPLSFPHWRRVRGKFDEALGGIAQAARMTNKADVLYAFMNDVIVRLSSDLERRGGERWDPNASKSTLRHASEKAIESYFHLFHLLLCVATENPKLVTDANKMIASFVSGKTSKTDAPNLGWLLIALLISDTVPTEELMKAITKEAIVRNVVWLLDRKGAGMAELAYLESDKTSAYRLKKTFEASRTSYRLLMFSELFRRTARPSPTRTHTSSPTTATPIPKPQLNSYATATQTEPRPAQQPTPGRKTLSQLRDDLFRTHGGPGPGTAAHLASEVRRLQKVDDFPSFLHEMGIRIPSGSEFTGFLRKSIAESRDKGYSAPQHGRHYAVLARLRWERDPSSRPGIEEDMRACGTVMPTLEKAERMLAVGSIGFFPGKGQQKGQQQVRQVNNGRRV